MKRDAWERWLVISGAVLLLPMFASSAHADAEEVARRLDKYGKLSGGEARKLVSNVSSRMKRAADMSNTNDPMRQAVAAALGSAGANDAMTAAKVRLRLYAGLNEWALDNLFAPRPGAMATCTGQFGLRGKDCEALLAAAGRMNPQQAAKIGAGTPVAVAAAGQPAGQAGGSRFGSYNAANYGGQRQGWGAPAQRQGWGAPQQQQPAYGAQRQGWGAPQQQQQPAYGAQRQGWGAQQQPARPAYGQYNTAVRPAAPAAAGWGARPAAAQARPAPVAVAPQPTAASIASRKAEYERKRQEYLDRKKAEMEARKTKIVATAGGTERVQRGPASAAEAEAVGMDPATVAAAPVAKPAATKGAKGAPAAAAAAEPEPEVAAAEEAPVEEKKPQLDNSFLEGLMDDPLGKSK